MCWPFGCLSPRPPDVGGEWMAEGKLVYHFPPTGEWADVVVVVGKLLLRFREREIHGLTAIALLCSRAIDVFVKTLHRTAAPTRVLIILSGFDKHFGTVRFHTALFNLGRTRTHGTGR